MDVMSHILHSRHFRCRSVMRWSGIRVGDFDNELFPILHSCKKGFIEVSLWELRNIHTDCIGARSLFGNMDEGVQIESNISASQLFWLIPQPSLRRMYVEFVWVTTCDRLAIFLSR